MPLSFEYSFNFLFILYLLLSFESFPMSIIFSLRPLFKSSLSYFDIDPIEDILSISNAFRLFLLPEFCFILDSFSSLSDIDIFSFFSILLSFSFISFLFEDNVCLSKFNFFSIFVSIKFSLSLFSSFSFSFSFLLSYFFGSSFVPKILIILSIYFSSFNSLA